MRDVAALFVETDGVYFGLPNVDPWDERRDAREYAGPHPVVAHPPCERWGRYWYGGPMLHKLGRRKTLGDDGGCFAAALRSVADFGGVIEHPEASHAWRTFEIPSPPRSGGWTLVWLSLVRVRAWTCCVEQGHYGHRVRKMTWLLYCGSSSPPSLVWGKSAASVRLDDGFDDGFHSKAERRAHQRLGAVSRLARRERAATPTAFRDVLLGIARGA